MTKGKIIGLAVAVVLVVATVITALLLIGNDKNTSSEDEESSNIKSTKSTTIVTTAMTEAKTTKVTEASTTAVSSNTNSKIFSKDGLSITLTDAFVDLTGTIPNFTSVYQNNEGMVIFALKENFGTMSQLGINENSTVKDYGELVIKNNGLASQGVTFSQDDDFSGFTYVKNLNGVNYAYTALTFKSNDAFWLVQFAIDASKVNIFGSEFEKYAKSIVFY